MDLTETSIGLELGPLSRQSSKRRKMQKMKRCVPIAIFTKIINFTMVAAKASVVEGALPESAGEQAKYRHLKLTQNRTLFLAFLKNDPELSLIH